MTGHLNPHDPIPLGEAELEALFAQARAAAPPPLPSAIEARLLAAAEAAQAGARRRVRPGLLARLRAAMAEFGGMPGLASVTAAGVTGLWLGLAGPVGGSGVPGLIWQSAAEVSPAVAEFLAEATPFDDFDPQD